MTLLAAQEPQLGVEAALGCFWAGFYSSRFLGSYGESETHPNSLQAAIIKERHTL